MRKSLLTGAYAICVGFSSATATADDAERIIEHRIAGFRDMGAAFKSIGDELKTPQPNVSRIRDSARVVRDYSKQVPGWFPPGSEPPQKPSLSWLDRLRGLFSSDSSFVTTSVYDSKAKPEIWQQKSKFTLSYKEFQSAVEALWSTAQGGDVVALKERHRAAAKTCGNCHDSFRERMD